MRIREETDCQTCGARFIPKSPKRRHCYACAVKTREIAARASKVEKRLCAQCGAEFTSNRSTARFCSAACRIKHFTKTSDPGNGKDAVCVMCGDTYVKKSKTNMTCSVVCSRKRSRARGKEDKINKDCAICGAGFTPRRVLDVCCSPRCSNAHARKARAKQIECLDCGAVFTHETQGVAKRCVVCRAKPMVTASEPCCYCGERFEHATTESSRFCSRKCSALGINAEGIANAYDSAAILPRMLEFIRTSRHTPSIDEICEHAGVNRNYPTKALGLDVGELFKKAGRENRSLFPSKFEERVYYCMLDLGLKDEQIIRQKKFPGLRIRSKRWPLRFDFHVAHLNLLVEADGEQHELAEHPLYDTRRTRESDGLKNNYAASHNIRLVRVPYSPTIKGVLKSASQLLAPYIGNGVSKAI